MDKKERKQVCINLPIGVYVQLEKNADKRKLDKTNYIAYLIQNDKDDMYSEKAARALENMSYSAEQLLKNVNKDDKLRPFVVGVRDGVKDLWQCLR